MKVVCAFSLLSLGAVQLLEAGTATWEPIIQRIDPRDFLIVQQRYPEFDFQGARWVMIKERGDERSDYLEIRDVLTLRKSGDNSYLLSRLGNFNSAAEKRVVILPAPTGESLLRVLETVLTQHVIQPPTRPIGPPIHHYSIHGWMRFSKDGMMIAALFRFEHQERRASALAFRWLLDAIEGCLRRHGIDERDDIENLEKAIEHLESLLRQSN